MGAQGKSVERMKMKIAIGALQLVRLGPLMSRSQGRPEVIVALIDGPVALDHPDLAQSRIKEIPAKVRSTCLHRASAACIHATFVAGMLVARRGAPAPAICPGCTLLVRPIFTEGDNGDGRMPSAPPQELAAAISDVVGAGANVINLSAALAQPFARRERELEEALDYAAQRGVLVVVAAGNQGTVASSTITRHPWAIPVVSCNPRGRPTAESNLGGSIGRRGLAAPGENVVSLGTDGTPQISGGTSAAAPFVTGAIALLWSEFPAASAASIKLAVTQAGSRPRSTIAPPLLDAWAAYEAMSRN
jgi:subtilisin family serine protease